MKRSLALTGLTLAVCALACAQDSGNRVVVPGKNGTHARMVEASLVSGSIVVKTGGGNDIIVEVSGSRERSQASNANVPAGMHRIDTPWNAPLQVEENGDVLHVTVSPHAGGSTLMLTVPANISLKLNSTHGSVTAEGVHGEVDAESTHGDINLTNVSGTVVANTVHGNLKVSMSQVDQSKPLAFTTMNGDIDVTLPSDVKANVKLRALRGEIWTDFEVKLTGSSPVTRSPGSSGRYQIMMDRTMNGTINGGGVEATFYTVNGKIVINKK